MKIRVGPGLIRKLKSQRTCGDFPQVLRFCPGHHSAGKGSVGVHAQDANVLADLRLAGAALQTFSASHVYLRTDLVAFRHRGAAAG
jgi:hypothetical protein